MNKGGLNKQAGMTTVKWTVFGLIAFGMTGTLLILAQNNTVVLELLGFQVALFLACQLWARNRKHSALRRMHFATVEALATAIDAKHQVSHEHVRRVQIYAEGIARKFDLPEDDVEALRLGALLHDIGKLAVPDYILTKQGKLSPAEFEKMKVHTTVGARILERVGFPIPVVPIVKHHHERWDGQGYPDGLAGNQIPLTARILSVVDCFDAMREDRTYRRALSRKESCDLLRSQSGRHFDPQVVNHLLDNLSVFEEQILRAGLSVESTHEDIFGNKFTDSINEVPFNPNVTDEPEYLEQIAKAHNEVSSLYEIARTFSTSLDLEDTLTIFLTKLRHIIPFELSAIYLYDEETRQAKVCHSTGHYAESLNGHKVSHGDGVTGWVVANRQSMCNANPLLDLACIDVEVDEFKTLAAAPMIKGESLVGVISLYSSSLTNYTPDHIRLLETISSLAADAIANARNHAETREFALTDALTGVPNARALRFQFAQEVNRANRQNVPLSILMMDLDGFKKINDTYGHEAGNTFLVGLAKVIGRELRSYDFLARYAGDEFVAILPGATEKDVEDLMFRIQCAVEKFALPEAKGKALHAGISLGTARYGIEANSLDRLIRIADRRMYKNKRLRKGYEFILEAGENGDNVAQVIARS